MKMAANVRFISDLLFYILHEKIGYFGEAVCNGIDVLPLKII